MDFRNGFSYRGLVLSSRSTSVQMANIYWDGGTWGRFGGTQTSLSFLDVTGCPLVERQWYALAAYGAYYERRLPVAKGWMLSGRVFRNWMTFPGCIGDIPTVCHWGGYAYLVNPYVVPFGVFRWADVSQRWSYWNLGLCQQFRPLDRLKLMPAAFVNLGDGRQLYTMFGPNPNSADGQYSAGLMAMNVALYADYALTKWLSLTAFLQQYIALNADGRDALDASRANSSLKEMTLFGIGLKLKF